MGRPLRIGVYSPFFGSTIGGGEKYLGVTLEALRDGFAEAEVELFTPVPVGVERYERMLGLDLRGIRFRSLYRGAGAANSRLARVPMVRRYRDLLLSVQAARGTADYDLLVSMVYVLPAFSRARRGVILCQFPYRRTPHGSRRGLAAAAHRLYTRPYEALRRRLLGGEFEDFQLVICQSEYVRGWVQRFWHRDSVVVNPPIDVPEAEPDWSAKRNLIVSVGRFFAAGHNKRHDLMVEAFRDLCDRGLEGWELHLAGSVHRATAADVAYLDRVHELARGYPVSVHLDAPRSEVQRLYREASVYWHAAGLDVDASSRPADLEHFGMTTVEAMASGAVPVVVARGGQLEVVQDAETGFLWDDLEGLKASTLTLVQEPARRRRMGEAARAASLRFSRQQFTARMVDAVRPLVEELRTGREAPAIS